MQQIGKPHTKKSTNRAVEMRKIPWKIFSSVLSTVELPAGETSLDEPP